MPKDLSASVTENLSLAERLASAYKRLAASSEELNAASDEFTKPIAQLDAALQVLNLGVITWQKVIGGEDDYANHWRREVGYARVGGKWGLAIRAIAGNHNVDDDSQEQWLFSEAPRSYRIEAIEKIPDLLEELIKNADKTTKKLKETTVEARELAAAVKRATVELQQQKERR